MTSLKRPVAHLAFDATLISSAKTSTAVPAKASVGSIAVQAHRFAPGWRTVGCAERSRLHPHLGGCKYFAADSGLQHGADSGGDDAVCAWVLGMHWRVDGRSP
jgi:hypothetical protein